jgi:hypothetical protein
MEHARKAIDELTEGWHPDGRLPEETFLQSPDQRPT